MNADAWFGIGSPHVSMGMPCQDYVRTSTGDDRICIALSDGCSSAGETDIGARSLVLSGLRALHKGCGDAGNPISLSQAILNDMRNRRISDRNDDYFATLLLLDASPDLIRVFAWGDGVVFARDREGNEHTWILEWDQEMPFYLQYFEYGYGAFIDSHSDTPMSIRKEVRKETGELVSSVSERITKENGTAGIVITLDPREYTSVSLFSDGIERVHGVAMAVAIETLTGFKNTEGSFQKRRAIRACKEWQKQGFSLMDDLAVGTLITGAAR